MAVAQRAGSIRVGPAFCRFRMTTEHRHQEPLLLTAAMICGIIANKGHPVENGGQAQYNNDITIRRKGEKALEDKDG